jgi:hypothetical protein
MSRGVYQPLDRRASPLLGLGLDYAANEARQAATAAALRPVAPAFAVADRIERAYDGARGAYLGTRAMGGFGGPSLARIGQDWFHGAADRQLALASITADLKALSQDLGDDLRERHDEAVAHPDEQAVARLSADIQWVQTEIQPAIENWRKFVDKQAASTWTQVGTDWTVYEEWKDKVRGLRQLARARGFVLHSAEPTELPKTIWQRGAEGEGGFASWLGIIKLGAAAAVAIAGFASLYAALRKRD